MDNRVIKHITLSDGYKADLNAKYWDGLEPDQKQDVLKSGVNIKTINGNSILGSGNIDIEEGAGGSYDYEHLIEVLYKDLVTLRNNSELIPGKKYRITDYVTTTSQENTQSAGHQFDIIVTALTKNELSEIASACYHEENYENIKPYIKNFKSVINIGGVVEECIFKYDKSVVINGNVYSEYATEDTKNHLAFDFNDRSKVYFDSDDVIKFIPSYYYFYSTSDVWEENVNNSNVPNIDSSIENNKEACKKEFNRNYFKNLGCNLSAWKIWYSLDNNSDRFTWADSNGTGVIYKMIDEWGNDCPYDFKNIQFREMFFEDEDSYFDEFCYTFSWEHSDNNVIDASIFGNNGYLSNDDSSNDEGMIGVYENVIGIYNSDGGKQCLNYIVFLITYSDSKIFYGYINNIFGNNCYNNIIFGYYCHYNTFGNNFHNNVFGYYLYNNTFGYYLYNNTFGNFCHNNILGNNCYNNVFGDYLYNNTFGNNFHNNTFGNRCHDNSLSNNCNNNTFGNDCQENKFGIRCGGNTFGNRCDNNTFGGDCQSNTFGNGCCSNTFGNNCQINTFGNYCSQNIFKIDGKNLDYVGNVNFDNGCSGNTILIDNNNVGLLKNYNINKGVNNQEIHVKFPTSPIEVNVWVASSGEVIQEYINDFMTDSDIDEIWDTYFNEKI